MKKSIAVLFGIVSLFGAHFAFAEMTLIPSSHPVYGDPAKGEDKVIVGYISNIDWDRAMAEADARNGQKLPIVLAGQTTKDEGGVEYLCPEWFTMTNCVSLVKTPAYRTNMMNLVASLKALGTFNQFSRFKGWENITK